MLADPQHVLDLTTDTTGTDGGLPARPAGPATLYLHVDARHLEEGTGGGTIERLGAGTLDLLQEWLSSVGSVRVQPVLDLGRDDAVDRHDPPGWMQTLVILRDRHCVFPGCRIDARRCDLDHIQAYDEHGPPGQTHPRNLAPLCRRHHNAKTHNPTKETAMSYLPTIEYEPAAPTATARRSPRPCSRSTRPRS